MRNRRWLWIGLAAVVVVAAWMIIARRRPLDVETAEVDRGALRVTVDEAGTTRVRHHAEVSAPITGRFVPAGLRVGDSVTAGTTLGQLYPAPLDRTAEEQARQHILALEASQREASSRVRVAQGNSDDATRTLERVKRLFEAGGASQQELERARIAQESAASELEASKERVREAGFELQSSRAVVAAFSGGVTSAVRVSAPERGRLLRLFEEHERVVSAGTPLAQVGDPRELEVVIPLLSADAMRVRNGSEVRMTAGERGDTIVGHVTLVEPSAFTKVSALGVEEQRVNVVARIPSGSSSLGDQYRVDAKVTVWEAPSVVRVPTGALVRAGERWAVFVLEGGTAHLTPVTLGERGAQQAEVRSGLTAGQRVILYPGDKVVDGGRVRAKP